MKYITQQKISAQNEMLFDYLLTGKEVTTRLLQRSPFNFANATARISDVRKLARERGYNVASKTAATGRFKTHTMCSMEDLCMAHSSKHNQAMIRRFSSKQKSKATIWKRISTFFNRK